ncbi:MAG: CHRD domain-containing protein [Opitutaceae bacterium]
MKNLVLASLSSFCLCLSANAISYNITGSLDTLQAGTNGGFGGGTGSGNGTLTGSYDDATKLFDYSITFADLEGAVTNAHFHIGAPGVSGGVGLGIPGPFTSPLSASSVTLDLTQETDLLAGNWYVNIHTSSFGGGEIRGQVFAAVPESSSYASILGVFSVAALVGSRRRRKA